MTPADEILGKIEQAHQAGQHLTGPQAGCSLCAAMVERGEAPLSEVGPEDAIDMLARRGLRSVPPRHTQAAAANSASDEAFPDTLERGPDRVVENEPTLGGVALEDAQIALDQIESLAQNGIVIPNEKVALVYGVVGAVRALAGIEEVLRELLAAVSPEPEVLEQGMLRADGEPQGHAGASVVAHDGDGEPVTPGDMLIEHIHGNEHTGPMEGCPKCAKLIPTEPPDDAA
jgi:hypothetical protein